MKLSPALKIAIEAYDLLWPLAIPLLRRHRRLADGFDKRLASPPPGPADVWIQAASAGEAYLALELVKSITAGGDTTILLTTNTRQGLQILETVPADNPGLERSRNAQVTYFPFDRPGIMQRAVKAVAPRVMVMLETEIWPGHLLALKQSGSRILLVNGRLTAHSLKRYLIWPSLWEQLGPDQILCVSAPDAERFEKLFPSATVATMPNMKFDRMAPPEKSASTAPQAALIPAGCPFVVLGSIRREEEEQIGPMIASLRERLPRAVIGLFPRHMDRMDYWRKWLQGSGFPWQLRTELNHEAEAGSIVLWDIFGELASAYIRADAAFVGGSLQPLGGQNFLEPLMSGILPVIGPNWENFYWVGPEIVEAGLLQVAADWRGAAALLAQSVNHSRPRSDIRAAARDYIDSRRGGTQMAADLILKYLQKPD